MSSKMQAGCGFIEYKRLRPASLRAMKDASFNPLGSPDSVVADWPASGSPGRFPRATGVSGPPAVPGEEVDGFVNRGPALLRCFSLYSELRGPPA